MTSADTTERVHLSVAEARALLDRTAAGELLRESSEFRRFLPDVGGGAALP